MDNRQSPLSSTHPHGYRPHLTPPNTAHSPASGLGATDAVSNSAPEAMILCAICGPRPDFALGRVNFPIIVSWSKVAQRRHHIDAIHCYLQNLIAAQLHHFNLTRRPGKAALSTEVRNIRAAWPVADPQARGARFSLFSADSELGWRLLEQITCTSPHSHPGFTLDPLWEGGRKMQVASGVRDHQASQQPPNSTQRHAPRLTPQPNEQTARGQQPAPHPARDDAQAAREPTTLQYVPHDSVSERSCDRTLVSTEQPTARESDAFEEDDDPRGRKRSASRSPSRSQSAPPQRRETSEQG